MGPVGPKVVARRTLTDDDAGELAHTVAHLKAAVQAANVFPAATLARGMGSLADRRYSASSSSWRSDVTPATSASSPGACRIEVPLSVRRTPT